MSSFLFNHQKLQIDSLGKIAIIFNRDDVLNPPILERFLSGTKYKISALYEVPSFTNPDMTNRYTKVLMSLFSTEFLFKYGIKAIKHSLLSSVSVGKKMKNYSVMDVAEAYEIPYFRFFSVNQIELRQEITNRQVNTILSLTSQIYKKRILSLPHCKIYNFHPANLPENKGLFPIFWAILAGKNQVMTCHQIVRKIDEGPIVFQEEIPENSRSTVESVMLTLFDKCDYYLEKALDKIGQEDFQFIFQQGQGSYDPIPDKHAIRRYKEILKKR